MKMHDDGEIITPMLRRSTIGRDDSGRSLILNPASIKKRPLQSHHT
jgi:hypothetical protein